MKDEATQTARSSLRIAAGLLAHLVFWGWNAVFLAFTLFGVVPTCGLELLSDTVNGVVPLSLTLSLVAVVLVPVAATALAAVRLRRDPARLFRLFYGVEVPLFLLALGRLFLVRDVTPGVAFVIGAVVVGVASFLHEILASSHPRAGAAALAGDTVGLAVALHAAALLSFLAIPVGVAVIGEILRLDWIASVGALVVRTPAAALVLLVGVFFTLGSATLFALAPPALIALYVQRFARGARATAGVIGRPRAALAALAVLAGLAAGFVWSGRQPQHAALAALAAPPANDAERRARLAEADVLRAGLVNAYLAPWRYLGSSRSHGIRELWSRRLHLSEGHAGRVQAVFDALARAFVYDGDDSETERRRAGDLYGGFFDRSIQRAEKDAILSALEATYSRRDREAGLLAQGEQKVHVARQEIRAVSERGALAEIEIHEVFENRTLDQQEVLYFFSLPETAAVTGLWLGDTDRRDEAFAFTVSSRGAAQRVYRAEVTRRRDPALIEQVGPRQYRLRAFPIPAREQTRDARGVSTVARSGRPMHLWLRYRVLAEEGAFPLPRLIEARNAFRDRGTERFVDGRAVKLPDDVWLPPSIAAGGDVIAREHRARLDDGTVIVARPAPPPSALPQGARLAVVLDRSHSMRPHAERVIAALGFVRDRIEPANDVDLYLTSAPSRGEPPIRLDDPRAFDPGAAVYYGGQDPADLLAQLDALRGDTRYDGVVVLTDEGGFDLAGPKRPERDLGAPVWMVHLGGALAPGYDDATLATIQARGGGATTSVEAAFARLADPPRDPVDLGWADGYRWAVVPDGEGPHDAAFAALAAHRWIPVAARSIGLDRAHAAARSAGVVSPFSSMIVLVDDAQRRALAEAEKSADRFERDTETGEARVAAPSSPLGGDLTGTPEPEEWVLLGLAALGLLWAFRSRARFIPAPA